MGFAPKYTGILIVAIVARLRTGHKWKKYEVFFWGQT